MGCHFMDFVDFCLSTGAIIEFEKKNYYCIYVDVLIFQVSFTRMP
jgi:hypothetical protein